jgi:DNA modification methylase
MPDTVTLLHGHVLDVLDTLQDNSVQMFFTSPPFWGKRDYALSPVVWLNGRESCVDGRHEWIERTVTRVTGNSNRPRQSKWKTGPEFDQPHSSDLCAVCGAWRGQLGQEPLPELYVEHIVQVMRAARRVLRPDGTLWLNIADTYWGGKGKSSQAWSAAHTDRKTLQKPCDHIAGKGTTRPQDGRHPVVKPKDLCLIPERVALALQEDGWFVRHVIPWPKRNGLPESVRDRPVTGHEYVYLLSKTPRYYYDRQAVKVLPKDGETQTGHTRRTSDWFFDSLNALIEQQREYLAHLEGVRDGEGLLADRDGEPLALVVNLKGFKGAHFAAFPERLVEPCIRAGTSEAGCCARCGAPYQRRSQTASKGWKPTCKCGDAGEPVPCVVLDLFGGSGTTGVVAQRLGRRAILIDANAQYIQMARERIEVEALKADRTAVQG